MIRSDNIIAILNIKYKLLIAGFICLIIKSYEQ